MRYEIRLDSRLPADWADWFDGFSYDMSETGEAILIGQVQDQAALIGLLAAVCRLNLTLLLVKRLD
ncbi:MAG: hypothetical protein ACM3X6_11150 [Patescibacteria group bacterium]